MRWICLHEHKQQQRQPLLLYNNNQLVLLRFCSPFLPRSLVVVVLLSLAASYGMSSASLVAHQQLHELHDCSSPTCSRCPFGGFRLIRRWYTCTAGSKQQLLAMRISFQRGRALVFNTVNLCSYVITKVHKQ